MIKPVSLALTVLLSTSAISAPENFSAKVDEVFSDIDNQNAPGCAVGVIEQGKWLHKAGYGMANLELNVPITTSSIFRLGSVSKQFTAMAVLVLAEEGKIDLEEDIRTYLPELRDYGHKISVNAMLGHFAGMADYDFIAGSYEGPASEKKVQLNSAAGGPFRLGNEDYLTIQEFYDLVKQVPLRHEPNQKADYSNLAYFLLSMLVEEVSGKSLREYADEKMFKPLGMDKTFFSDNPVEIVKNRASGYKPAEQGGYVTDMTNLFWVGDGGLHSSIDEFMKWDQSFYKPVVGKNPESLMKQMNTPNSEFEFAGGLYANGQAVGEMMGRPGFVHTGGWLGTSAFFARFPDDQFSIAIFCNNAAARPMDQAREIVDLYFGK